MSFIDDALGVASIFSPSTAALAGLFGNQQADANFKAVDKTLDGGGNFALDLLGMVTGVGMVSDMAQAGYHMSHAFHSAGSGRLGEAMGEMGDFAISGLSAATGGMGSAANPLLKGGVEAYGEISTISNGLDWFGMLGGGE